MQIIVAISSTDVISNGTTEPSASNEEPPQPPKDEDDGKTIRFILFLHSNIFTY